MCFLVSLQIRVPLPTTLKSFSSSLCSVVSMCLGVILGACILLCSLSFLDLVWCLSLTLENFVTITSACSFAPFSLTFSGSNYVCVIPFKIVLHPLSFPILFLSFSSHFSLGNFCCCIFKLTDASPGCVQLTDKPIKRHSLFLLQWLFFVFFLISRISFLFFLSVSISFLTLSVHSFMFVHFSHYTLAIIILNSLSDSSEVCASGVWF